MTEPKYTGVDTAATLDARAQMDDQTWWKPKSGAGTRWGNNYVRIMPPHPALNGKLYFGVPLHFSIGPNQVHLPCPRKAFQSPCPVCVAGFELRNQGQEEAGNDLLPTWIGYMCVIEIDENGDPLGDDPKIRIWSASRGIIDDLLAALDELGDFTDLEKGFDINVKKRGSGKTGTKYQTIVATKPSKFPMPELADGVQDLTKVSPYVAVEVMQAALDGVGADPMLPKGKESVEGKATETQSEPPKQSRFAEPPDEEGEEPAATPSDTQRSEAQKALKDAVSGDDKK